MAVVVLSSGVDLKQDLLHFNLVFLFVGASEGSTSPARRSTSDQTWTKNSPTPMERGGGSQKLTKSHITQTMMSRPS